jgi:nucleoid DNA-binding protein
MNTSKLREYVYKKALKSFSTPLTQEDTSAFLDTVIDAIMQGLVGEESEDIEAPGKVMLRSFGTFTVITRKGRTYSVRGKQVTVPDRKTVVFKPGTDLARALAKLNGQEKIDDTP